MTAVIDYQPIHLPSRGAFYGGAIPDGAVSIRKMTTREEAVLDGANLAPAAKLAAIVENCTKFPEAFTNKGELLLTDMMAILYALRTLTFGSALSFEYRCEACGAKNKATIDTMADFTETLPKEGAAEPFEVMLKDAGVVAGVRLLRVKDNAELAKRAKRVALQSADANDVSNLFRLAVCIVNLDGRTVTLREAEDFVKTLTLADSARIRNTLDRNDTGITTDTIQTCRACRREQEVAVILDAEFFRPTDL